MPIPLLLLLTACIDGSKPADEPVDTAEPCTSSTWYADADGDGFGAGLGQESCIAPEGHVSNDQDCDDGDPAAYPGATERCNGVDDDCDGQIDPGSSVDAFTCWGDADGDGYGVDDQQYFACACAEGYATVLGDCDDEDPTIHPGAVDTWYDDIDQDCLGDDDFDADGDGYTWDAFGGRDCGDGDAAVHPEATEICGNGIDDNCDGLPAACGLSEFESLDDADQIIFGETISRVLGAVVVVGDNDGDGVVELATGRKAMYTDEVEELEFLVFQSDVDLGGDPMVRLDSLVQATLRFPSTYTEMDLFFDLQPQIAGGMDLDGDGYGDFVFAGPTDDSVIHEWSGLVGLAHGPIVGDLTIDESTMIRFGVHPDYALGSEIVAVHASDTDAIPQVALGVDYSGAGPGSYDWPVVVFLTNDEFGSDNRWLDAPGILRPDGWHRFSWFAKDLDVADVDGDGLDDLVMLVQTWDGDDSTGYEGRGYAGVFLGPFDQDRQFPDDADVLIHEDSVPEGYESNRHGGVEMALIDDVRVTGTDSPHLAFIRGGQGLVGDPEASVVRIYDLGSGGQQQPEDAVSTLTALGGTGLGLMSCCGDLADDGSPELAVAFTSLEGYPGGAGRSGVLLVEPPLEGVWDIYDRAETILQAGEEDPFRNEAMNVLMDGSLDGDSFDDVLVLDAMWNGISMMDFRSNGQALLFRGGPSGY